MNLSNSNLATLSLLAAVLTLGLSSPVAAQYRPVTVEVSVSADETRLVAETPSQCAGVSGRGCIEAPPGVPLRINLVLGGDESCSAGGRWGLTDVFLGGENSSNKPGSWGGLRLAAQDFDVDPVSGRVQLEPGSNRQAVRFTNDNTAAYDVWYTVQAECNGEVIELDPRIRNGGVGG